MTPTPFAGVPSGFYSAGKLCPHCRHVFFRPFRLPINNWNAQRVCKERACRLIERRRKDRERESTAPARTTCEFCKAALPKGKKRCCNDPACKRAMRHMEASKNIQAPSHEDRVAKAFRGLSFTDSTRAPVSLPRLTMLPEPNQSLMGNGTAMCASARRT